MALWAKLPVGERLQNRLPRDTLCPLDGQPETMEHALRTCKYLPFIFDTVDKWFPHLVINGNACNSVVRLLYDFPGEALLHPPGILAWSGILTNWEQRQIAKHKGDDPGWHLFLASWIRRLTKWQLLSTPLLHIDQLAGFLDALIGLRDKVTLVHPQLNPDPPTPPPSRAHRRRQEKHGRKISRALQVTDLVEDLEQKGYVLAWTDGSSKKVKGIGDIVGYGVYAEPDVSFSTFLPTGERQTNNTAELFAAVKALQLFPSGRLGFPKRKT